MPVRGPLSHIDLTILDPERSIPFYAVFFQAIGWTRFPSDDPDFREPNPERAAWFIRYDSGAFFGIEIRPALGGGRDRQHDRYAPGLHHMAFHAESKQSVDDVHAAMRAAGASVLDPPADYSELPGYSRGYYAAFFADPDGIKLEVVFDPLTNQ